MSSSTPTRYAVVKFVPDRLRFEPINIGIVVEDHGQLMTLMASGVDPRVRFADPYADIDSIRSFLEEFDARAFVEQAGTNSVLDWLHDQDLPNVYITKPEPIDAAGVPVTAIADALFSRLVERDFARPMMLTPAASRTAARNALLTAFRAEGLVGSKVLPDVVIKGTSGIEWRVDFQFTTDKVNLVQAATTGLREDLRRKEHAFEAFASLIDTKGPGVTPVLASDALPRENDASLQIRRMADAHGIRFVGGRRAFLRLAREVRNEGLLVTESTEPSVLQLE